MLPSHNCIIIFSMFSFQGTPLNLFFKKLNEAAIPCYFSQSLKRSGGPKWTRTIDLTIISRVL